MYGITNECKWFLIQGYVDCTRQIVSTTRWIAAELRKIDGVRVIGCPDVSVVAIGGDDDRLNVYALSEQLKKRGWNLNALQFPPAIHLCCTMLHTKPGVREKFVRDVAEVAAVIVKDPAKYMSSGVAMYGELLATSAFVAIR